MPTNESTTSPSTLGDQMLPLSVDDYAATPYHSPILSHWILTTSLVATHPGTQWDQLAAPRGRLYRLWMGRRPRLPHSHTDWRISCLEVHRSQPRVSPRPQQTPTSPPSCRTPPIWSTLSGASTPRLTLFNSPLLPKIHNLLAHPLSKMYRKTQDAHYVTTSILRQFVLLSCNPSPLPSIKEIKTNRPHVGCSGASRFA